MNERRTLPPLAGRTAMEELHIQRALSILDARLRSPGECVSAPDSMRKYLRLLLAEEQREVFLVIVLDSQHRMLHVEPLFHGTLTQTSVYPREVVKLALSYNAGAVIFCHNHPSGNAEPSRADEVLTCELKAALALVEVRVLDHFIVAGRELVSFAELGLI